MVENNRNVVVEKKVAVLSVWGPCRVDVGVEGKQ